MCFLFLGALTFFTKTKRYALVFRRLGAFLMKKVDEEFDDQPCSSSEIREDVEEISITVESIEEGVFNCAVEFITVSIAYGGHLCSVFFTSFMYN